MLWIQLQLLLCATTAAFAMHLDSEPNCVVDTNGSPRCYGLVVPPSDEYHRIIGNVNHIVYDHYENNAVSEPPQIDYSQYMLRVHNQLSCGSCWDYSTIAVIEGLRNKATGVQQELSAEDILSCCSPIPGLGALYGCSGCSGGLPITAFAYVKQRGVCPDSEYPYKADKFEFCKWNACTPNERVHVKSYGLIKARTHRDLATALEVHGPIVIGLDASNLHYYTHGLFTNCSSWPQLNHAVALIGLVKRENGLAWRIRNSWGPNWGENGDFYMPYDRTGHAHDCGILNMPTYGVV